MAPSIATPPVHSPKTARISAKRGASAFAVTAFSGALLAPVPAAFAVQDDPCPVGTEGIAVSVPGLEEGLSVCEVQFTTPGGPYTWTPPAGVEVTAVEALLVGGGGGGTADGANVPYAGGGGEVKLVSLIRGEAVEIVVGKGGSGESGSADNGENGTASTVVQPGTPNPLVSARGGQGGQKDKGGASGNGNPGGSAGGGGGGGGAGGEATDEAGGLGLRVSDLLNENDYEGPGLFAGVTTGYGGGGSVADEVSPGPNLDEPERDFGGGSATADEDTDERFVNPRLIPARPNSGGGGGGAYYSSSSLSDDPDGFFVGGDGADGIVIIRFAYITPEPEVVTEPEEETTEEVVTEEVVTTETTVEATETELPRTGGSALLGMLGAGAVLAGLGGGLTYLSRRRTL